jgi:3-deoxy-manno-octulosonate cytidylyltransferase (CMP-KDO synthetase)
MASTRFPGKPLAIIRGMSMIERVWRIGSAARFADDVVIATDSEELRAFAEGFGAKVLMTTATCRTGTDRVAEAARMLPGDYEIVFSLQGDAVLTPPWVVDDVLSELREDDDIRMATPAVRLVGASLEDFIKEKQKGSTSGTTVVFNRQGDAMYFSKGVIPFSRDPQSSTRLLYRHIGLYGYRSSTLERFTTLPEGQLERIEKLEQLRALEHGIPIRVVEVDYRGRTHASVDRPEDLPIVEAIIDNEGELISG